MALYGVGKRNIRNSLQAVEHSDSPHNLTGRRENLHPEHLTMRSQASFPYDSVAPSCENGSKSDAGTPLRNDGSSPFDFTIR